jgi:hypothetical protein
MWSVAFFGSEETRVTSCIMRSLRRNPWCYWSAVDCDVRATVVEVGWWRCCMEDCWECCSSLGLARWGVLFSEAREWVDPAGPHFSFLRPTPIAGYVATSRTYRANTRTALFQLNLLNCPLHLANFHGCSSRDDAELARDVWPSYWLWVICACVTRDVLVVTVDMSHLPRHM